MARLFGFSIEDTEKTPAGVVSPIPPNRQDGSEYYVSSGFYGSYVDIEGVYKTENDLLRRYRQMSLYPECDSAIEDIVNEAIVSDTHDSPIEIELSNLNASDGIKKKIREEFKFVCELLDFDKKAHEIFRNWYIDGRLYYNKVIDQKDPHAGIQELRYIDASRMKYIRQIKKGKPGDQIQRLASQDVQAFPGIEEYFMYTPQGSTTPYTTAGGNPAKGIKLTRDSITYCTSGLVDRNKGTTLSWLHKAIKPLNQLMMIEDSLVIYRLSRAPERRIFYIDVGNLPKVKAEQYLRDVMMRYRNKLVYDANTGEMRDDKKFMSMMEDFWLPRREGGRGTEITTLPGGQNLGEITDINYFQKKLYRSLNVPETRIAGSDAGFSLGRSSEILRDEVKFSKFVGRMRKRFTHLFNDILRTQLLLKNVVTPEDWDIMSDHIQYDFLYDNHFAELKDSELLQERLNLASAAEPYVGKYYSADYIRRKVLRQTDQEIIDQDKQIKQEIAKGIIPDPNAPVDPATGQPIPQTNGVLGKNTLEPEVEEEKFETSETPSGGEI
ncbi:MAG: hypothetical protein CM15mL2_2250 [Caudoviricetes sp.]|mgnify:FL=1|nr:MAG: hypothetical protein CM15mL2_2250 [Caudoviricetes sp.]